MKTTTTAKPKAKPPIKLRRRPDDEKEWNPLETLWSHARGGMSTADLVALLDSKMTVAELSSIMLADRGLDKSGVWVGFDKALKIHNIVEEG